MVFGEEIRILVLQICMLSGALRYVAKFTIEPVLSMGIYIVCFEFVAASLNSLVYVAGYAHVSD